jgi:hypothetical protein
MNGGFHVTRTNEHGDSGTRFAITLENDLSTRLDVNIVHQDAKGSELGR